MAFDVTRDRFDALARVVVVTVTPLVILSATLTVLFTPDGDFYRTRSDGSIELLISGGAFAAFVAATFIAAVLGIMAQSLAVAGGLGIAHGAFGGTEPGWRPSFEAMAVRARSVLLVALIVGLGVVGGLVLCIVPGIVLGVGWSMVMPVLLFEDRTVAGALGRSWRLVRQRFWPVAGVLALFFVALLVVSLLVSLLVSVVTGSIEGTAADIAVQSASSLAVDIVMLPLLAVLTQVLFIDLRWREHWDQAPSSSS